MTAKRTEEYLGELDAVLPEITTPEVIEEVEHLPEDPPTESLATPVLISLIRQHLPKLIANDLIGVQPMTGPVGMVFDMKMKFDQRPEYIIGEDPHAKGE